ncbi:hypothetical protein SAMN05216198_1015 [Halopseudomonas litoralis]|uniref:Phage regulatory protein CII (CP76) n=1 Tax=Halopseudomonas litoralis TaxID=797277 RepID=A0A1H1NUI8_9GAMM|nr:phage regulatory CII family protein [Halopseudomonas litoralis]SDS02648.1 hypothetical protein SAMN05216198_1015 [Halopseudomonas litoralis]
MSRKDLLPDAGPVLTLRQALYRACRDYRGGINAVALMMGIDPDALAKAVNPNDSRPMRPEWIEEILTMTGDTRLIAALVRPAGAIAFIPEPVTADAATLRALAGTCRAKGDFVESLHLGSADGVWQPHEVALLKHHAAGLISSILSIVAGAEQAMEADHG